MTATPTIDLSAVDGETRGSRRFLKLALGFWRGTYRRKAWLLTAATLLFVVFNLSISLGVNRWNKFFFDALERKDIGSVMFGLGIVGALAVASAIGSVGLLHSRMRLQLSWRRWLTRLLVGRWLSDRHFYQLTIVNSPDAANPEARIAEDGRVAIELLVDFSLGILNAVLGAVAFISILWVVGGALTVGGVRIPGYMVLACIAYSGSTTTIMYFLGRRLVERVEDKAAGEAQLRYEMTRVKDNAETIALTGGDDDERARLDATFKDVAKRWLGVITWQGRMMWLNGSALVLAPVVPLLLGAPKYLAGEMTLGSLMQAATAFAQVQVALTWLADNAMRLSDWFASSNRVSQLTGAIDRLELSIGATSNGETIEIGVSPDRSVHLVNLNIALHDGKLMIDGAEAVIAPGEKVMLKGGSGTGKSSLIRAMAGLWPWGSGKILLPEAARVAFMPQRPYFPLGPLRQALLYPFAEQKVADEKLTDILARCGLEHLIPRLDETEQWGSMLSGGEQQRLAFARVLINPPDILIMDEPTSALDELSQFRMMEYMRDLLPDTMVIHAAHRPGIERFHDREIELLRETQGGPATTHETPASKIDLLARAVKRLTGRIPAT